MNEPFIATAFVSEEAYIDFCVAMRRAFAIYELCRTPESHISPCPDGSIDIHCKTCRCEVLINVPPRGGPVTFYGDNAKGKDILRSEPETDDAEAVHRIVNWIGRHTVPSSG